jgi:hypothetical protein
MAQFDELPVGMDQLPESILQQGKNPQILRSSGFVGLMKLNEIVGDVSNLD